ncbi:MAG: hypothetical protein IT287_06545, partial [Bdellovibrionaceae bacterium]|nr:hypothetical protein [Pseudobdellovibrionaceae bacterium]
MIFLLITQSWADTEKSTAVVGNQLLNGIAHAGIVVQILLLSLIALSVWNWFIIFKKRGEFQ